MTVFKGFKTGFNKTGNNQCVPNAMGPPATKFTGRGALPAGPLKHYPGGIADIGSGNRGLSKAAVGDDGGSSTRYSGRRSGFNRKGT